jgi:glycosyltransferase involved in cell wall biosynthesis
MAGIVTYVAGKDPLEETAGGHSSYVRAHAYAAVRAGYEPHLFCVSRSEGIVETGYGFVHRVRSPLRFVIREAPSVGFRGNTILFHAPLLAAALERFLENRPGPHLIHGFALWCAAGVIAGERLAKKGVDSTIIANAYTTIRHETAAKFAGVSCDHGFRNRLRYGLELLWERLTVERLEKRAITGAGLVLVNYESVKNIVSAQFGTGIKFQKFPYCSEAAFLREKWEPQRATSGIRRLKPADAPLIVTVSRHDPRKGLDVFLKALGRLREGGIPFRACLVGTGVLEKSHRQLAERLGLGDSVSLEGFVPDPFFYLDQADIFVLPSLEEGSGSVSMLEALQAGTAVVASRIDGIPEDVTHGDSALLVEPGNVGALAEALRELLQDEGLRKRISGAGRKQFDEKFSSAALTSALGSLYAGIGFSSCIARISS